MIKVSQGCLGAEELDSVGRAFAYGYFGMAASVAAFEEALQEYLGAPHVIAVNSGTSALHLALDALGIGAGDEVIVPSLTFVACFQAIALTGATPVACDVRPETLLIDLEDAERRITKRTRALLPVHYAGSACDLDDLFGLADRCGLHVVEDAAHAFGSTRQGRRIGGFGEVACFSFDSIKTITCAEGGAVTCRDGELAATMRRKRILGVQRNGREGTAASRGVDWHYEVATQGFRYHMSDINASIGLVQLAKVEGFVARRRELARRYDAAFAGLPGIRPLQADYGESAPHIYVIRVDGGRRDALMEHLARAGIETAVSYIPNHLQPHFRRDGVSLPVTERAYAEILTLPLHCALTDDDVDAVISEVRAFAERARQP
jgi:dTDP-4-amino-4,6-dideoxygalactose transaminase